MQSGTPWRYYDDYQENYTKIIAILSRECREWAVGETDRAVEAIIAENCGEKDAVVFTNGSVQRLVKSGVAYTIHANKISVAEK